jgi:squalene-hopene/tetraprenyl-beta-curcumene cyclase
LRPEIMQGRLQIFDKVAVGIALGCFAVCTGTARAADKADAAKSASNWSPAAAAHYLDQREQWWQGWDRAQKDHGTLCISCHTQAPFAFARPVLGRQLDENVMPAEESAMLASVRKRVRDWGEMLPFYSDALYGKGKEVESRNAESVLNSVILLSYDAGKPALSDDTLMALDHAWKLQSQTGPDAGAWVWQNFEYSPWEAPESQYYWTAQLAVALGRACNDEGGGSGSLFADGKTPVTICGDPNMAPHLALQLRYLRSHYQAQPLLNQLVALWADRYFPSTLSRSQRRTLVAKLDRLQHADGGWTLADLGHWVRRDKTPEESAPDGFATGLVVLVLEETQSGAHASKPVASGLAWLRTHQNPETGAWPAWSLNKNRDPKSNVGQFMSDAATGYAVLALDAQSDRR